MSKRFITPMRSARINQLLLDFEKGIFAYAYSRDLIPLIFIDYLGMEFYDIDLSPLFFLKLKTKRLSFFFLRLGGALAIGLFLNNRNRFS